MEPPRRLGVTIDCLRSRRWVSWGVVRRGRAEVDFQRLGGHGERRAVAVEQLARRAAATPWVRCGACVGVPIAPAQIGPNTFGCGSTFPFSLRPNPHRVPALGPVDRRQRAHRLRGEFPAEAQVLQITNMVSKAGAPIPSVHAGTRPSCPRPPCFFPIFDFFFSPHRSQPAPVCKAGPGRSRSGMRARSAHSRILASRLHVFSTHVPGREPVLRVS